MPAAGVPDRVAVPLPLSVKLTPAGRAPAVRQGGGGRAGDGHGEVPRPLGEGGGVGAGDGGASFTVRVKLWVASGPTPLWAVMVRG